MPKSRPPTTEAPRSRESRATCGRPDWLEDGGRSAGGGATARCAWGCCHGASYGIAIVDEGVEEPVCELAALVERQRRVDLAAEVADLRAWDMELHASSVYLQAKELERAGKD